MKHINNYLGYIKKYGFNSIFVKNFITLLLIIAVPFGIVSVVVYHSASNAMKSEEINITNEKASHLSVSADNFVKSINRTESALTTQQSISVLTQSEDEEVISLSNAYSNIMTSFMSHTLAYDYITSIGVYAERMNVIVSDSDYTNVRNEDNEYVRLYTTMDRTMKITPAKTAGTYTDILFCKRIYNLTKPLGMIFIKVDLDKFFENIGLSVNNPNSIFALCKDGRVIVSSDTGMIDKPVDSFYNGSAKTQYNGTQYVVSKFTGTTGYDYYYLGNETMYALATKQLVQQSAIMIFFIILMSVLISIYTSAMFYRPLSVIIDKLRGYGKTYDEKTNEITYITNNILDIGNENIALNREIQDKLILLNNTHLTMLQNQINPHFLHNTLETIKWYVVDLEDDNDNASSMIEKLSKILRYSLDNNEYVVSMAEETEYTQTYIDIMSTRYADRFTVDWLIAPDVRAASIMKLSLQPIIENAISHGILPRKDNCGKLTVKLYKNNNALVAKIADNGIGIDEARLDEIRAKLAKGEATGRHGLGMCNVNSRIKLIYGDEYGVSIKSSLRSGTVVTLRMGM